MFNLQNDSKDNNSESQLTDDENSFQKSDKESLNEEGEQNVIRRTPMETPVNGNKKLMVAPHRNRNVIQSQNQAHSKIVKAMEDLAGAQIKWRKLMIEADKKTDELFLKHKADEAQQSREYRAEETRKNREHELKTRSDLCISKTSQLFKSRGSVTSIRLSAIYAKSI